MITETQNQTPAVNVYPNAAPYGNGAGDFFGGAAGGGIFFWLILFFFMMMFMGWGNNGNNGNNGVQYVPYAMGGFGGGGYAAAESVRQGFDQSAIINGLVGVQNAVQNGFSNAEVSRCNQQANILATMNNNQIATTNALNTQAMALQNCCCENRAGIADVKYALATEACADRAAVTNALQELTAQNNMNMNAMANMFNAGIQSIKDQMCNDKIDEKNAQIADLQRQLTFAQTTDLVNNSRNAVLANNDLQTAALEQYLAPVARPAYIVQNPNCCSQMQTCTRCCGQY